MIVELRRTIILADGAFGFIVVNNVPVCLSLERTFEPGNKIVIPPGDHPMHRDFYHRGGHVAFEIDVQGSGITPGRVHDRVLIHPANNEDQLRGCVAPGTKLTWSGGKRGVGASKPAFNDFMAAMKGIDEATFRVINP